MGHFQLVKYKCHHFVFSFDTLSFYCNNFSENPTLKTITEANRMSERERSWAGGHYALIASDIINVLGEPDIANYDEGKQIRKYCEYLINETIQKYFGFGVLHATGSAFLRSDGMLEKEAQPAMLLVTDDSWASHNSPIWGTPVRWQTFCSLSCLAYDYPYLPGWDRIVASELISWTINIYHFTCMSSAYCGLHCYS